MQELNIEHKNVLSVFFFKIMHLWSVPSRPYDIFQIFQKFQVRGAGFYEMIS